MAEHIDILIIEDRPVMRAILRDFLQSGFPDLSIGEARSSVRAYEMVREGYPRIVLLDNALADANGIELTAKIKALAPHTQVIIVSEYAGEPDVERADAAGAFALIEKQKIYAELIPSVGRALRKSGRADGCAACG
jgi:DNA-binding NarL/FixJ family response regulator